MTKAPGEAVDDPSVHRVTDTLDTIPGARGLAGPCCPVSMAYP
ncbi:MAG: hypothetical protein AAF797_09870 [Planctomycetota bacterium]